MSLTGCAVWLVQQGQSGEGITAGETRRLICWRPFTEVLNTADLKVAKALLDPLASLS
jgi:hypothetical protein